VTLISHGRFRREDGDTRSFTETTRVLGDATSVWYAQTEAQFALKDITADATKYYYVVAALGSSTAGRVTSILEDTPERGKYALLKDRLLEIFGLSDPERAHRLLSQNGLEDSKPSSELMDKMLALLGRHRPDFLFKELSAAAAGVSRVGQHRDHRLSGVGKGGCQVFSGWPKELHGGAEAGSNHGMAARGEGGCCHSEPTAEIYQHLLLSC